MKNETIEKLLRRGKEIEAKTEYYGKKLRGKKSLVREEVRKAEATGILPRVIGRERLKVGDVWVNLFHALTAFDRHEGYTIFQDYSYLLDYRKRMYCVSVMDHTSTSGTLIDREVLEVSQIVNVVRFSKHYMERFEERNKAQVLKVGILEEAVIMDLLSDSSMYPGAFMTGRFIDPEIFRQVNSEETIKEFQEILKDLANGDERILKYLSEDAGVVKTNLGYGIYSKRGNVITMITWLKTDMLSQTQKDVFWVLTQGLVSDESLL